MRRYADTNYDAPFNQTNVNAGFRQAPLIIAPIRTIRERRRESTLRVGESIIGYRLGIPVRASFFEIVGYEEYLEIYLHARHIIAL